MEEKHHRGHETPYEGPRFSRGEETTGDTEEKEHVGDFAEGQEAPGHDHASRGRFSEGQEAEDATDEKTHQGDFAVGQESDD
jgi:hypothetical protein